MDKKVIELAYQIYQKKYGGSIVEISILFVNVTEALEKAAFVANHPHITINTKKEDK